MRKNSLVVSALFCFLSALLLTSCSTTYGEYIEIPEEAAEDAPFPADTDVRVRQVNDFTADGRYIYTGIYKIDTVNKTSDFLCGIPGCAHNTTSCESVIMSGIPSEATISGCIACDGGLLQVRPCAEKNDGFRLVLSENGEVTELYLNTYTDDYEKEVYGTVGGFNPLFTDGETVYCSGPDYWFSLSLDGKLLSEPLKKPEEMWLSGSIALMEDGRLFSSSMSCAWAIDLKERNVTKLCDFRQNARSPAYFNGRIYCVVKNDNGYSLQSCDLNGEDVRVLIEDFGDNNFYFLDGKNKLLYLADNNTKLYTFDLSTNEKTLILDISEREKLTLCGGKDNVELYGIGSVEYLPNMELIALRVSADGEDAVITLGINGEEPTCYTDIFDKKITTVYE